MVGPSEMNFTAPLDRVARKTKVLVFNKFYLPGYRAGGPIRTIANMVDRLGDTVEFRIVTADRDSGDGAPYADVDLHGWHAQGNALVRYVAAESLSLSLIQRIIEDVSADSIYLNSFFDPGFTQRVLWLRRLGRIDNVPVVLAPRGEFSAGALALKSIRKSLFLRLAKVAGLYEGLIWQVSSEHEKRDLTRVLGSIPEDDIKVAMDLAPSRRAARSPWQLRNRGEPLRLCFLSRVAPMKNLDFALECLRWVDAAVVFTIYGPLEVQEYWAKCKSVIETLPSNVSVVYSGEVDNVDVCSKLAQEELFFLPTRGENYGHVIHEALSAGLPVLISDLTPWRNLEAEGVGWSIPLSDQKSFAHIIDEVAAMDPEAYLLMRERAASFATDKSEDASVLEANRSLFVSRS